jgi:hypothetical protein
MRSSAFSLRSRFSSSVSATDSPPVPSRSPAILGIPVAQRALVDSEITSDLRDRFSGLPDDPHSPLANPLLTFLRFSDMTTSS